MRIRSGFIGLPCCVIAGLSMATHDAAVAVLLRIKRLEP